MKARGGGYSVLKMHLGVCCCCSSVRVECLGLILKQNMTHSGEFQCRPLVASLALDFHYCSTAHHYNVCTYM